MNTNITAQNGQYPLLMFKSFMKDIIPFLSRVIKRYADIPEKEIENLSALLNPLVLRNKDHFITQGENSRRIGIIYSGFFRLYTTDYEGNEKTLAFRTEGQILAGYSPIFENGKSWYSIQSLTDSEIMYFDYDNYLELERENPGWIELLKNYIMQIFIEKAERERSLLQENASERYLRFLEQYPDYEEKLSQYLIASYLGISPVSLSRIRSNLYRSYPA